MATRPDPRSEIKLDPAALFLEEVFTDRRVGTIRRLTPVDGNGAPDPSRKIVMISRTNSSFLRRSGVRNALAKAPST